MHFQLRWLDNPEKILVLLESRNISIKKIRKMLYENFHVPPELQQLVYDGKMLEDGYSFQDYDINMGDVIEFTVLPQIEETVIENPIGDVEVTYVLPSQTVDSDKEITDMLPSITINSSSDSDVEIMDELPSIPVYSSSESDEEGASCMKILPKKCQSSLTDAHQPEKKYPEGNLYAEAKMLALEKTANKGKKLSQQQITEEFTPPNSSASLELIEVEPKAPRKSSQIHRRVSDVLPATKVHSKMEGASCKPISSKKCQSPLADECQEDITADSLNAKCLASCLEACDSQWKTNPEDYLEEDAEMRSLKTWTAKQGKKLSLIPEDFTPPSSSSRRGSDVLPSTSVNSSPASDVEGACSKPISSKKFQSLLTDAERRAVEADSLNAKVWAGCLEACDSLGKKEFVARVRQEFLCIICQEVAADPVTTPCLHNFCQGCLKLSLRITPGCPSCGVNLARRYIGMPNNKLKTALRIIFKGYDQGKRKAHFALGRI